ncbi:S-layer homology domain-containing protein [Ornithinibacillus californiensis]|uniref:S-layer homology domain-containing protein n=1 Tax=Ornithinibacillus californiensis TaxID=161536 RepID=UPI00064DB188|nr:S-layer homology domain-containing protein [Ornithinibacillus californiensis]
MISNKSHTNKKILSIVSIIAIILSLYTPIVAAKTSSTIFSDISVDDQGYSEVLSLVEREIINGYGDGTFKPWGNISRQHVAVMLTKALNLPIPENLSEILSVYHDVDENHLYASQIAAVTKADIFQGSNGSFGPEKMINREQVATVLVKSFQLQDNNLEVELIDLQDIDISHRNNVNILAQHQVTVGKVDEEGNRYFDGGDTIKRVQFAIFLDKILKLTQIPSVESPSNGGQTSEFQLKDNGATAVVSSDQGFTQALQQNTITKIELTSGFTASNNNPVNIPIVVPSSVQGQSFDFNGTTLSSLEVNGDNITIKNATVSTLLIGSEVENITLENVKDASGSEHTFAGGGANSIHLSGDTVFVGDIKITSGTDLRITSDNPESKIEGTIWIESEANTKIDAPVSTVVIDSYNHQVTINDVVDELVIRSSATLVLGENATITNPTKRVDVEIEATYANGSLVVFETVLDKHQLNRILTEARFYLESAVPGSADGQYNQSDIDNLEASINSAELVLDNIVDVTIENQQTIDSEAEVLQAAVGTFKTKKVVVDLTQLQYAYSKAGRIINQNPQSDFPGDTYSQFTILIEEASQLLYAEDGVTQVAIDSVVQEIETVISELPSEMTTGSSITYFIESDDFAEESAYVQIQDSAYSEKKISRTLVENGMWIEITDLYIANISPDVFVSIETNGYVLFDKLTKAEAAEGYFKVIKVDETYRPFQVSIPGATLEADDLMPIRIYKKDVSGAIYDVMLSKDTRVPYGTYNVNVQFDRPEMSYNLFKESVTISETNNAVEFNDSDIVNINVELDQYTPVNYEFYYVTPYKGTEEDYSGAAGSGLENILISKGNYRKINLTYQLNNNNINFWEIQFSTGPMDIQEPTTITTNDRLLIVGNWMGTDNSVNATVSLDNYLGLYIKNSLGHKVTSFNTLKEYYNLKMPDKRVPGTITVEQGGVKYTKELNGLSLYNVTINDIVSETPITGEAELIISFENSPIPIQPISYTIEIQ